MKSPVSALCGSITAKRHRNPLNYLIVLQPDSVETLSLSGSLSEAVMNFSSFHYGRPRFGRFWNGFEMGTMKSLNAKCDYMQRVALLPPTAGSLCYSATAPVWESDKHQDVIKGFELIPVWGFCLKTGLQILCLFIYLWWFPSPKRGKRRGCDHPGRE